MLYQYKESNCFLGRTLELEGPGIGLSVTLDVGPRIISLRKPGGPNLMFEDVGDAIGKDCSAVYGPEAKWHIYGGHRIWLSPEDETTYYPDNDPVSYRLTETGAVFAPPAWRRSEVQPSLEVRFLPQGGADIVMGITNLSDRTRDLCLWSLTVLKSGGRLECPLPTEDTGYLANRNLALWPYTDLSDPRLRLHNDKIIVESNVSATGPIKIGYFNRNIDLTYSYGDTTFKKTATSPQGRYPDFGCNVETYTNALIHEVETLSPIVSVAPGQTLGHTERWQLF